MSNALNAHLWSCIAFPDSQQRAVFQRDFQNIAQLTNVVGCVDSMFIPIKVGLGTEAGISDVDYGCQYILMVVVCGPQFQIISVMVHFCCHEYDWQIFRGSALCNTIEVGELGDAVFLVDEYYPIVPNLLRPIDEPQDESEVLFNLSHYVTRQVTSGMFHALTRRFPCLKIQMEPIPPTNLKAVVACIILHNLSLRYSSPLPSSEAALDEHLYYNDIRQQVYHSATKEE
ncbi:putative nuclease HARBI1 [Homarus americanus]|nr:putative nuclease HARBI1 [Homarus americanus]